MRPSIRSLTASLLALPLFSLACGGDGPAGGWSGSVRDSAGVAIVTNPEQGLWTESERWVLAEELRIGVVSGDPELEFGLVNGVDADDQGRIYVLDQQAARIRVFDADGELLHAFGRPGQGPGELSQATVSLFVTADGTLLVPDMMNQRIGRFTPEGEPLTGVALDFTQGIPLLWLASGDRSIYQQTRPMALPGMPALSSEPRDFILRRGPDGTVSDTAASFSSGDSFQTDGGGFAIRLFAPEPVWAVLSDGRLVTGRNSEYSLEVRDADGQVRTIVRRDVTRRPVTEGDKENFRDAMSRAWDAAGVPAEAVAQLFQMVEFADEWPALASIVGGPEGTLWVQRVDTERAVAFTDLADLQNLSFGSPSWDVLDGDGRYLGVVETPPGFTPRRFLGDAVYGTQLDELGVQRVLRLGIGRGGR